MRDEYSEDVCDALPMSISEWKNLVELHLRDCKALATLNPKVAFPLTLMRIVARTGPSATVRRSRSTRLWSLGTPAPLHMPPLRQVRIALCDITRWPADAICTSANTAKSSTYTSAITSSHASTGGKRSTPARACSASTKAQMPPAR